MDPFGGREGEEDMFGILRTEDAGEENGSQFLNDSGPGMKIVGASQPQISTECDDGSQNVGPPEVY